MQLHGVDEVVGGTKPQHSQLNWGQARNIAIDVLCVISSLYLAAFLASDADGARMISTFHNGILLTVVPVAIVSLVVSRVYMISDRYLGLRDLVRIGAASFVATLVFTILQVRTTLEADCASQSVLFFFLVSSSIGGVRLIRRAMSWHNPSGRRRSRTFIVGAGDAGEALVREIQRSSRYEVVGFLDDAIEKRGVMIHSVRVLGAIDELIPLAEEYSVDEVLIALPSAQGSLIRKVYEYATEAHISAKTLPSVHSLIDGGRMLSLQLRDIRPEDLLRRGAVASDREQFVGYLQGQSVLVTGGGGSIGSELARQIAVSEPLNLVLLGRGENSIYEIEQELINTYKVRPFCAISDVRNLASIERVFERYHPDIILHAAAHKHVPLMESNPIEAIENNIRGTWNMVQVAIREGCSNFILVSTDKAVNPKSVMGASKRVCELIIQAFAQRTDQTKFAIVRFGNVLGSRGSIMPLLMKQIKNGGPVTITHPEMTRYFMTIPEAADLILQAGAFGRNGEIFLLDMGEPVKIKDLAYDLIRMHGLVPERDLPIEYTGARPGEKTFEELTYEFETSVSTPNEKIRQLIVKDPVNFEQLDRAITQLFEACRMQDERKARTLLMDLANERVSVRG